MSEDEKPRMKYGSMDVLRRDGANNVVYLIPAEENGGTPEVFVWGNIGSGQPERAFNHRWYCIGTVHKDAVPEKIEERLREYEDQLVEIAGLYHGHTWDGSNHVGAWSETSVEIEQTLEGALNEVATYCTARDRFSPVGMHAVVQCDMTIDEWVEAEDANARLDDAFLDTDDMRDWFCGAAQHWLDKNKVESDSPEDAILRNRLLKMLGEKPFMEIMMDNVKALSRQDLEFMVGDILEVLYPNGHMAHEWGSDTIHDVSAVLRERNIQPEGL